MGNENVKPLTDEELDLFVATTKLDKENIIQNYDCFNTFAEDGKLKPETCSALFGMFLPGKNSTEVIKLMFESFDTDNNGYLDFKEFLIGTAMFESKDNTAFGKLFFKLSDKDKSNGVDKQELKQIIKLFLDMFKEVEQAEQSLTECLEAIESLTTSDETKTEVDQLKSEVASLKLEVNSLKRELNELKGIPNSEESVQVKVEVSTPVIAEESKLEDVSATDVTVTTTTDVAETEQQTKKKVNYEEIYAKLDLIVDEAYNQFDKDKKGYLNEEEFIAFFNDFESKY